MPDERWLLIAERIRTADAALSVGQRICHVANEFLGARSVSLALYVDHAYSPLAASDDLGVFLDEQQFALGDGPSFDARRSAEPVILDDCRSVRTAARWPIFAKIAESHGVPGTVAFPLSVGNAHLGVLTAYRAYTGQPSGEQYADGLILASMATAEMVHEAAGIAAEPGSGISESVLYRQSTLQLAAGMVAEALNISIVAALARIRARAFADDQPVSRTAQRIVARELSLDNNA